MAGRRKFQPSTHLPHSAVLAALDYLRHAEAELSALADEGFAFPAWAEAQIVEAARALGQGLAFVRQVQEMEKGKQ